MDVDWKIGKYKKIILVIWMTGCYNLFQAKVLRISSSAPFLFKVQDNGL